MAHMYVHHIGITIQFLLPTLLPFSWAGWLSFTRSVRYSYFAMQQLKASSSTANFVQTTFNGTYSSYISFPIIPTVAIAYHPNSSCSFCSSHSTNKYNSSSVAKNDRVITVTTVFLDSIIPTVLWPLLLNNEYNPNVGYGCCMDMDMLHGQGHVALV
jgi:hypothetical protein